MASPEKSIPQDLLLDLTAFQLTRAGQPVKLEKTPMELLALLVRRRGALVTREEIVSAIWGDNVHVDTESGINTAIRKIRHALDDNSGCPRYVETVVGKGYRFIGPIKVMVNSLVTDQGASTDIKEDNAPVLPPAPTPKPWNRRRFAFSAIVATFLILAALVTWRVLARPRLNVTDVILLASFVNKTGDPIFDNSLDKALEVKLTESPFLSVFPEADARATMRTMRRDPNEPLTRDLGIEICKRQGLKALVVPEIAAFGSRYLITLEAINARNQESIAVTAEEADSKLKVISALGQAASKLRTRLGESLSSLEKYNAPLDLATTSSLEALQAYRTGQTLYRSGRRGESVPFFERAIELDPQFCSAYVMLGSVYHSLGDEQASRKNFVTAFELKDRRLTQEENFQTTALYHASITGNLEKETAVLVLYQQVYPRSAFAHNLLGITYAQLGRTEEALQEFYWAIDHSPVPSAQHYSNAGQALMILGRFDEVKKILDKWRQKGSLNPFEMTFRYRIAFFENDVATMGRLARETPGDDISWVHLQMQLAFLRGDLNKLRSLSETLVQQQRHANRMENVANELAWHAGVESYLRNYGLARALCRQAEEIGNNSALGLMKCAKALGDAGEMTQAEALAAKLDRLFPEDTLDQKMYLPLLRSIIERKRGNTSKAVELLAGVTQFPNVVISYHRAQAYLAAGDYTMAVADFEKVIEHRGWPEWEIFAPLAQLGLARAYTRQADHERSRKAYQSFLTIWKDADPEIPILSQAKAEYKKLTITASGASPTSGAIQ